MYIKLKDYTDHTISLYPSIATAQLQATIMSRYLIITNTMDNTIMRIPTVTIKGMVEELGMGIEGEDMGTSTSMGVVVIKGIVIHGGGVIIVRVVMGEEDIRTVEGGIRVFTVSRVGRGRNIQSNMRGRGAVRGKVKEGRRHLVKMRE